jgi:protein-arginine kinase activator protein McsA
VAWPGVAEDGTGYGKRRDVRREIERLRRDMKAAAQRLDFETAAELRDRARKLETEELGIRG